MIITCEQCHKKFEIESNLIPEKGRLLQCSSCSHKWFYKRDILEETKVVLEHQDIKTKKIEPIVKENNNIKIFNDSENFKKNKRKHSYKHLENKKLSFLNVILVFIISIIASFSFSKFSMSWIHISKDFPKILLNEPYMAQEAPGLVFCH